jgi:hypothetical protein
MRELLVVCELTFNNTSQFPLILKLCSFLSDMHNTIPCITCLFVSVFMLEQDYTIKCESFNRETRRL